MTVCDDAPTLFEHVGAVLQDWSAHLGLSTQGALIAAAYDAVCRRSLDLPAGRRPLQASQLNADGTPFQLALHLGTGRPSLQFLSEAASPGSHGVARLQEATQAMERLAQRIGAGAALAQVRPWIAALAPPGNADVLACEAGALWLGAGVAESGDARMKVYVNARLGPVRARRGRLETLAARFDQAGAFRALAAAMPDAEALGAAVLIGAGAPPSARLYLTGQGADLAGGLAFAQHCGGAGFRHDVEQAARILLDSGAGSATRALVASVALRADGLVEPKVELCAPWIFDSDAQGESRCRRWLDRLDVDPAPYEHGLALCAGGSPDASACRAHAYVGVGHSRGRTSASFYFNPAAGASRGAVTCR